MTDPAALQHIDEDDARPGMVVRDESKIVAFSTGTLAEFVYDQGLDVQIVNKIAGPGLRSLAQPSVYPQHSTNTFSIQMPAHMMEGDEK